MRTGPCWLGVQNQARLQISLAGRCGIFRTEERGLFQELVGLIKGGRVNANSTGQVECWQESWPLNTVRLHGGL